MAEVGGFSPTTLSWALRLAWLAVTLPILAGFLPPSLTGPLYRLLLGISCRGKTMKRPALNKLSVPQSYFLHFYVVAVVLTTCILITIWSYAIMNMVPLSPKTDGVSIIATKLTGQSEIISEHKLPSIVEHGPLLWHTVFALLLMEIQVLRRLYETLYVFHYSPSARMHILGYMTGLLFYVAAPLSLGSLFISEAFNYVGQRITEFVADGRTRFPDLQVYWLGFLKPLLMLQWYQWLGVALFAFGWVHQLNCHMILGSLRKQNGASEYIIPHGDWFKYVSSPHYFAEIVIYAGILLASGGQDVTLWLLFLFVVANLSFSALETQRWYHQKFEDYPRSRRAIIPFLC